MPRAYSIMVKIPRRISAQQKLAVTRVGFVSEKFYTFNQISFKLLMTNFKRLIKAVHPEWKKRETIRTREAGNLSALTACC